MYVILPQHAVSSAGSTACMVKLGVIRIPSRVFGVGLPRVHWSCQGWWGWPDIHNWLLSNRRIISLNDYSFTMKICQDNVLLRQSNQTFNIAPCIVCPSLSLFMSYDCNIMTDECSLASTSLHKSMAQWCLRQRDIWTGWILCTPAKVSMEQNMKDELKTDLFPFLILVSQQHASDLDVNVLYN